MHSLVLFRLGQQRDPLAAAFDLPDAQWALAIPAQDFASGGNILEPNLSQRRGPQRWRLQLAMCWPCEGVIRLERRRAPPLLFIGRCEREEMGDEERRRRFVCRTSNVGRL
jgi:hypothetical protein